jgi:hypothetical protein
MKTKREARRGRPVTAEFRARVEAYATGNIVCKQCEARIGQLCTKARDGYTICTGRWLAALKVLDRPRIKAVEGWTSPECDAGLHARCRDPARCHCCGPGAKLGANAKGRHQIRN